MTVTIDLEGLKDPESPREEAAVLAIFDTALNSDDDLARAGAKLADELRRFVRLSGTAGAADELLWYVWLVLFDVIELVPVEHPWRVALVKAVSNLQASGGSVVEAEVRYPTLSCALRHILMLNAGRRPLDRFA